MTNVADAQGIEDWCKSHGISRALFYKLVKDGSGPNLMRAGTRVLITREASAKWRQEREAAFHQHACRNSAP